MIAMARDYKEIGHNVDLKGLIIHQISKTSGDRNTGLNESPNTIPVTANERKYIGIVHNAYHKKSSPNYGVFGGDYPGFRNTLKRYIDNEIDFLAFSQEAAKLYKNEISKSAPASGGFVVFAHYHNTERSTNNLLVLTTNNKDSFAIDESSLTISGIRALDMSKIDVACLINLAKWQEVESTEDPTSDTYLSFVRGNKEVSVYFMTFIDCNDKTTSKLSSKRLLKAVNDHLATKGLTREVSRQKKNDVYAYCDRCISENQGIQLSMISSILDPDNPNEFTEFASEEQYGVSAIISGNRAELKTLRSIYYRDDDMTISFNVGLLDKTVKYNSAKKELTFQNIPDALIEQIMR